MKTQYTVAYDYRTTSERNSLYNEILKDTAPLNLFSMFRLIYMDK